MSNKIVKNLLKYTVILDPAEEGGFVVIVPKMPGLITEGDSFEEAIEMAKDAMKGYLQVLNDNGEDIPDPDESSISTTVGIDINNLGITI
jgi:predicted RNase H-like HicB family nuclease